MKKMFALLLALLLTFGAALAETEKEVMEGFESDADAYAFVYSFDDDGYDGEWVEIPTLNMQFCLPEGWTEQPVAEDVVYAADRDDGSAHLLVYLEAEDVQDIEAWAMERFGEGADYAVEPAGQYTAVVREEPQTGSLFIDIRTDGDKVVLFSFSRTGEDALTREFALNIAGTLYEDVFAGQDFLPDEAEAQQEEAPAE